MQSLFNRPVTETYRIGGDSSIDGSFTGTFTLSYPSLHVCQIIGLVGCGISILRFRTELAKHIKSKGCNTVIYYRENKNGSVKKVIKL
jgi:hypothetical protein